MSTAAAGVLIVLVWAVLIAAAFQTRRSSTARARELLARRRGLGPAFELRGGRERGGRG